MAKKFDLEFNKLSIEMQKLVKEENDLKEKLRQVRDKKANLIASWHITLGKLKQEVNKKEIKKGT